MQLAKHLGARVIATGGDDARLAVVKRHGGADEVVNYRTADFVAAVKELTGGKGADVIYDPVGGEVLEKSMRAAAYGARLLIVGFTSGGPSKIMSNHVLIKGLTILGVRAGETIARIAPELGRDYVEILPGSRPRRHAPAHLAPLPDGTRRRCFPGAHRPSGSRQGGDRDESARDDGDPAVLLGCVVAAKAHVAERLGVGGDHHVLRRIAGFDQLAGDGLRALLASLAL